MPEFELNERQLEMVKHLANGMTTEEIGGAMFLSVSSVRQQLTGARKKCGAKTLPHLVSIVISQGVLFWTPDGRSTEKPLQ